MRQPLGFIDFKKPNHVYKLQKALYGLKQEPKAWYDRLKAFLTKHEYKMGMVDNTLFTKKKSSNLIIVQIYVDDIIFGTTCQDICDDFAKIMHDELEMGTMGELNFFLGLQIKQIEDGFFFNQSKYIKEMLKKFGLEDSKPMKTPMSFDTKLMKDEELSTYCAAPRGYPKPLTLRTMPLEQFQVNTKFLNTLPDEWSKFVTDVKLVKDLHTTNVDQLHAHLQQHERHVIEVRLMHERNPDPLALVASHQLTQPAYQSQNTGTTRLESGWEKSETVGEGVDEGTGVTPGVPDAPDYDSEDDISWKSSDDDQVDEQAQDDEDADKNDVNETTQDDEDDDDHDDDEKVQDDDEHDVDETVQDDDDEEQTESDDDGDDFVHPKLTTHDDDIIHEEETDEDDSFDPTIHTPSRNSSSDDEDSDNKVEGTNVEGAKLDEEATYEEDQGNEAVKDTNTDLDGRDEVMTDVILPQVQATQEIEDTHVTLTLVNPDGQQQSSSVSSGFVSNMLNPNQDTGVDDIFGQHTEATSLIDTPVTAIMEPSFTAQINRPPTPYPHVIQTQQSPILTPATTTSSLLQNLPNFASLFGFDYRLKALEDNFSELDKQRKIAEALYLHSLASLINILRIMRKQRTLQSN
ncbi:retrovirus-related pol polyprotein from transposon TNT 1-94 [Tanacetum coccineum]|uniref:Retrovirus-related pol polyprotein from transposon TNT 1-94 n=1 Tax=Tanacetum coccineum TaxID=301880 RepID=A0ABQ5EJ02_9ASTR